MKKLLVSSVTLADGPFGTDSDGDFLFSLPTVTVAYPINHVLVGKEKNLLIKTGFNVVPERGNGFFDVARTSFYPM